MPKNYTLYAEPTFQERLEQASAVHMQTTGHKPVIKTELLDYSLIKEIFGKSFFTKSYRCIICGQEIIQRQVEVGGY